MVFNKLKKFLLGGDEKESEQKKEEQEKESLSVEEVKERLRNEKSKPIDQIEEDVQPLLDEISDLKDKIEKLNQEIKNAEPEEEVHPKIYKSAEEARKLFSSKIKRALEKMETPNETNWDKLLNFNRKLQDAVNLLKNAKISHGEQISALFGEKMSKFNRLANNLQSISKDLNSDLREKKLKIDDFEELLEKIEKREELLENLEKSKEELESLKEENVSIQENLEEEKDSLQSLKKSERYEELEKIENRMDELSQKKEKKLKKIESKISSLARPLRKLSKMVERDEHMVDSAVLDGLDVYLDGSIESAIFEQDNDLKKLNRTLKELENVLEDKMKLSDRERKKRLDEVEEILDKKIVKNLKDDYLETEKEIEDLKEEKEKSSLLKKKERLENKIENKKSELKNIEEKKEELDGEINNLEDEINEKSVEIRDEAESILGVWVENL